MCDSGCNPDFIPVQWLGNFERLASRIGQVMGTYPNMRLLGVSRIMDLVVTQEHVNSTTKLFDGMVHICNVSYFHYAAGW
jgi:hypothetical protein